jgi:hypothetical protein
MSEMENITVKVRLADGSVKELHLEVSKDDVWQMTLKDFEDIASPFKGSNLYRAMQAMREHLEDKGCQLLCVGARTDVAPTGLAVSMGDGRKASVLHMEKGSTERLNIFDYAEPALVGTVKQQREYFEEWKKSLLALRKPEIPGTS